MQGWRGQQCEREQTFVMAMTMAKTVTNVVMNVIGGSHCETGRGEERATSAQLSTRSARVGVQRAVGCCKGREVRTFLRTMNGAPRAARVA